MRNPTMRAALSVCAVMLWGVACAPAVTTIIVVRHAEKGAGANPPLTPDGLLRAKALSEVVDTTDLTAIYVTQYLRTQQTAAPTATASGVEPTQIDVTGTAEAHGREVATHILRHCQGGRVLVVGHSNTVPWIIHSLGETPTPELGSKEFDRIFVVLKEVGVADARLIETRYGP